MDAGGGIADCRSSLPASRWSDAAAWEGGGLRREVFFFESGGEELYGSLYAAAEPSRPFGVVACGSWGVEADRTDPLVRSVALGMAERGGAGFVFHYPGYGDSFGDLAAVDLERLAEAAVDAVAEASRRCPGFVWILAGFMFGASIAVLAQRRAGAAALLLVQPVIRPGAYVRGLAERRRPLPPGPSPRELLYPGAAAGMAYGYPVPRRIRERAGEADTAVATVLADFAGEGAVVRHAAPPEPEILPDRLDEVQVAGAWRFASLNNPKLAAAAIEWLDRHTEGGGR
jgi:alpha/beta superfamily hydrolase